jgi:acetyl-CoA carboxylase biotin carboxyl carrier protein
MTEKQILELIDAFSASGLADLDLSAADVKISLRRFARVEREYAAPSSPPAPIEAPRALSSQTQVLASPSASGKKAEASSGCEIVTSPIVATFYRSPGPDAPPFVEQGKRVKSGQPLCILEAMKVMSELPAEFDMEIVRVLPENGAMVEYGQPIFEVRRV